MLLTWARKLGHPGGEAKHWANESSQFWGEVWIRSQGLIFALEAQGHGLDL